MRKVKKSHNARLLEMIFNYPDSRAKSKLAALVRKIEEAIMLCLKSCQAARKRSVMLIY